uniref:Uncharacterized protein n=1 Tax=Steinernema glaseri TaxID=37863 RepID=A0A1I7ZIX7_9BILA
MALRHAGRHKCTTETEYSRHTFAKQTSFLVDPLVELVDGGAAIYGVPEALHIRCFIVAGIQGGGRSMVKTMRHRNSGSCCCGPFHL